MATFTRTVLLSFLSLFATYYIVNATNYQPEKNKFSNKVLYLSENDESVELEDASQQQSSNTQDFPVYDNSRSKRSNYNENNQDQSENDTPNKNFLHTYNIIEKDMEEYIEPEIPDRQRRSMTKIVDVKGAAIFDGMFAKFKQDMASFLQTRGINFGA